MWVVGHDPVMPDSSGGSTDPYDGLDPDVIAFLDGTPPPARPDVAPVGAGSVAQPAAIGGSAVAGPGRAGASPSTGGGYRRRHVRSSWGAAATTLAVIVAAALLDPSGLAAPVAWTGAQMARQPWTWLQYVVLAPLIVVLVWWWSRRLLAAATPAAPRRWVFSRIWLLVILAMMVAKLALLRGAHGARPDRGVRGWAPAGFVGRLPGVGNRIHRDQGRCSTAGSRHWWRRCCGARGPRAGQVSPRGSRPRRAR